MIGDKIYKNNRGISLLELVVAISIFTLLILSSTQIFKLVIDGQRNAISAQNVQENIRYAMEKISKEIRMAQISNTDCLASATKKFFNTASSNTQLIFRTKDGDCLRYYVYDKRLRVYKNGAFYAFVTPNNIEVNNIKFSVVDNPIGSVSTVQPYVTMKMDIKSKGPDLHEQNMKIQMTVSLRNYE